MMDEMTEIHLRVHHLKLELKEAQTSNSLKFKSEAIKSIEQKIKFYHDKYPEYFI